MHAQFDKAAATLQAAFRRKRAQQSMIHLRSARHEENNSPQRILAAADRAWAERQRLMRQPGYVGFDQPRPMSPRRHRISANMTKHEILMSGDLRVMTERERPWGFGPDGPSDKEIVREIVERRARIDTARSKAKKKKGRRKFRELSKSSPTSLGLPKASSTTDRARSPGNLADSFDSSMGGSSTTESGSSSHGSDEDDGATQTHADKQAPVLEPQAGDQEVQPEPRAGTSADGQETNLEQGSASTTPPKVQDALAEAALEA